ncbi:MAG: hypothetical protein II997_09025 [Clostridia bacterium]|nr:hypothetical protein [Clostridia bacterium]
MGFLSERAAYLKGLADGLKIEEKNDEGKVIAKILDLLEEFAASIEEVDEAVAECEESIDELEEFAEELSDCFSDCEHDGCDCDCCDCDDDDELDDDELDDMEFYEVECPHCKEKVYFDEDMIDGELVCPNCDGTIEIEIEA